MLDEGERPFEEDDVVVTAVELLELVEVEVEVEWVFECDGGDKGPPLDEEQEEKEKYECISEDVFSLVSRVPLGMCIGKGG